MIYIKTLATLLYEFLITGMFAIGGGMATLPFLTRMGERHPTWFTTEELTNMIAVSESTPGPLGINMSTYVGYKVAGIPGVLVTAIGVVLPSVIIILIIARFLHKYMENKFVQGVFSGLHPAVTGLIAAAGWLVVRESLLLYLPESFSALAGCFDWRAIALFMIIVILMQIKRFDKLHPAAFIAASAVVGIVFRL